MRLLKSVTIENFKAIGEPVTIDLAPVTLLFGPNSAGKSSIIHALHYAYEVLARHNLDADRTLIGGEAVELGGFRNLVHRHETDRPIVLQFELDLTETDLPEFHTAYHTSVSELERAFSGWENVWSAEVGLEIAWSELLARPYVQSYSISINHDRVGLIECSPDGKQIDLLWMDYAPLLLADEGIEDRDDEVLERTSAVFDLVRNELIDDDMQYRMGLHQTNDALPNWRNVLLIDESVWEDKESNTTDIREVTEQISRFVVGPGELLTRALQKLLYIGPLRDVPSRNIIPSRSPDPARWSSGMAAWDILAVAPLTLLDRVNEWLSASERFAAGYQVVSEAYREVSLQTPLGTALESGELLDEEGLQEEFKRLLIHRRVRVLDMTTGIVLFPQDLGVGLSQMLPIVVAAVYGRETMTVVEQPELHLHPAIQVEMGDLFIEESRRNESSFLIETHSEHLLLRLLRRIREASAGDLEPGDPTFSKEELAVYFIETDADKKSASVRRLMVTDDGDFTGPWPRGFFEERAKELF